MKLRKISNGPLDRLESNAVGDDVLGDVTLALREISTSLSELKEQLAGRVKDFYIVEELAEMTGRAPYTVREWIREGKIHAERVTGTGPKGRLLIPRSELHKLVRGGKGRAISGLLSSKGTVSPDDLYPSAR